MKFSKDDCPGVGSIKMLDVLGLKTSFEEWQYSSSVAKVNNQRWYCEKSDTANFNCQIPYWPEKNKVDLVVEAA